MTEVSHVLMGEAGVCDFTALVAIAYMISRGAGPFYGWHPSPSSGALFAAAYWYTQPDPTPWANFVFSAEDHTRASVQAIIRGRRPGRVMRCAGGLSLSFYR
jgi:hypothetical protein